MLSDNKGFTLLEMLMVIFVMTVILYSFSNLYSGYVKSNKVSQSVMELQSVLDQAKYCAIVNGINSSITIYPESINYTCLKTEKYDIDNGVSITSNYPSNTIKFTENGTVNRAGTITIDYRGKQKQIVISIGNGGYYVK